MKDRLWAVLSAEGMVCGDECGILAFRSRMVASEQCIVEHGEYVAKVELRTMTRKHRKKKERKKRYPFILSCLDNRGSR